MSFGTVCKVLQPLSGGWAVEKREVSDQDWNEVCFPIQSEGMAELIMQEMSNHDFMKSPHMQINWGAIPQYRVQERYNFPISL